MFTASASGQVVGYAGEDFDKSASWTRQLRLVKGTCAIWICLDRQLHHRRPHRRAGDYHLGLLSAFRRGPGVLPLRETDDYGFFAVELADCDRVEQHYLENTAILITRMYDHHGGAIEVTDFAPRFGQFGRIFRPMMLIRRIKRLSGSPRLTLRLRPACDNGAGRPEITWGSNHIRYQASAFTLRLTTDASLTAILQETTFFVEDTLATAGRTNGA
jgi:hypothetical protein